MTQLESLASELLLDIFEFLETAHLIRAFFRLNHRFNQLVYSHFRSHQLNFQFLAKDDFDIVCQKLLPLLIKQVRSLRLSDDEASDLPGLLQSRGFTLDRFIHLQSLSLYNIKSIYTLTLITSQCQYLIHLTHLNIIYCHTLLNSKNGFLQLIRNIFSIPKLTHCNLNGISMYQTSPYGLSPFPSSIEYLSIENIKCNLYFLSHLFKCTPRLQRLRVTIMISSMDDHLEFSIPSLMSLSVCCIDSPSSIVNLLQKTPNLYHLMVETLKVYLDGYKWEQMITIHLPKIQRFHLKMTSRYYQHNKSQEECADELLKTFRTPFWLEKHRWYVRCHWDPSDHSNRMVVYTLPCVFNTFCYLDEHCSKSTCYDEKDYWLCNSVQMINNDDGANISFRNFSLYSARFPNIRCLNINLRFNSNIFFNTLSLNQLTLLCVGINTMFSYVQLQALLDQAPHLYYLKIQLYRMSSIGVFQLTSPSIRRLDLITNRVGIKTYFTNDDCIRLINSPLGLQCEVLSIQIKDRTSAIELVQKISNLRLLIFQCESDYDNLHDDFVSDTDVLVRWLRYYLPSTYSITKDLNESSYIRVWIDRQKKISNSHILILQEQNKSYRFLTSIFCFFSRRPNHEHIEEEDDDV